MSATTEPARGMALSNIVANCPAEPLRCDGCGKTIAEHDRLLQCQTSVVPAVIHVVVDDLGQPCFSATWPQACHEHINDAIGTIPEAKTWRVRSYGLMA